MKRLFLEKYLPASRASNIQKEFCGVRQHNGESLHEYWKRFRKLCARCPHHQMSEQLLIQYFYEGLLPTDRSMIAPASGGALVDKTLEAARNMIANMAANSQQFGIRLDLPSKNVKEMATAISRLEVQSSEKLPSQMVVNSRENASAIVLRSGKEVEIPVKAAPTSSKQEKEKNVVADRNAPNDDDVPKYAIKQVPRYAKFLKELCTIKRTIKLKDVRRSNAYPKGVVEDVLVQVNDLIFPTDFYVVDIENGDQTAPLLLGRPFLKISKTKIDVHSGTLTMEFDGEIVKFNIYDVMKYLGDDNLVYSIDVIDSFIQKVFELDGKDELEVAISKYLEKENKELSLEFLIYKKLLQR
ncbi:uncharacterized protein [Aristolochia californica]|uniref:uncharacterized protein n=1 Tax=Aristolochia californica TaxID=171875 RepID=UPI0035D744D0